MKPIPGQRSEPELPLLIRALLFPALLLVRAGAFTAMAIAILWQRFKR